MSSHIRAFFKADQLQNDPKMRRLEIARFCIGALSRRKQLRLLPENLQSFDNATDTSVTAYALTVAHSTNGNFCDSIAIVPDALKFIRLVNVSQVF